VQRLLTQYQQDSSTHEEAQADPCRKDDIHGSLLRVWLAILILTTTVVRRNGSALLQGPREISLRTPCACAMMRLAL